MSIYDENYDGYSEQLRNDDNSRSEQPKKRGPNWIVIILTVVVVGGLGMLLYKLVNNYRTKKCNKRDSSPEPQIPSSDNPYGSPNPQQPHPVMHQFPTPLPSGKSLAVVKAEQMFGAEALKHVEVLDMAAMTSLIVQTPDTTSIELARDGQAQIRGMVGMQPLPYKQREAMVMIMIYTSSGNCATCHAAAPKFVRAAVSAQIFYNKTPTAPLFKFAVIDYADMPLYMAQHISVAPSFLYYNPVERDIEQAHVRDLNLLDAKIMGMYKNISDQM